MVENDGVNIESHKTCLWFPDQKIFMDFDNTTRTIGTIDYCLLNLKSALIEKARLGFHTHLGSPYTLSVIKMHTCNLQEYKSLLDEILTDYQFVEDGWKGGIELDPGEWVWLQMMTQ